MFGSLMMFASGVFASSPSSLSASASRCRRQPLRELSEDPSRQRDVAGLELDFRGARERLMIGSSDSVASAGASSVWV